MHDDNNTADSGLTLKRRMLHALLAFLAVCAMEGSMTVAEGLETGSRILSAVSRLSNSFSVGGWADVLAAAAIYLGYNYIAVRDEGKKGWTAALSLLFALFYIVALNYRDTLDLSFFTANAFQRVFSLLCLLGWQVLFYLLLRLFFLALCREPRREEKPLEHIWGLGFAAILICWLPWILMNYPASFSPDSTAQIMQALGETPLNNRSPLLSTAVMGGCIRLGEALLDRNFGCFLYLVLQTVLGAGIFSYSVKRMQELGAGRALCVGSIAFFALTPLWSCFAQWMEKDLLYTELITLCAVYLAGIVYRREVTVKQALRLGAAAVLASLLRHNGFYELFPALLIIGLWLKNADRRRMLLTAFSVLALFLGVTRLLYPALGAESCPASEALSVPFQQTALYVNRFPDEVTEEERQAIDAVLDYDQLDIYDPTVSDYVKGTARNDDSKLGEYFRVWLAMALKHPGTYAEAFMMQCFGYMAPTQVSIDAYILSDYYPQLGAMGIRRAFEDMPTRLFDSIRELSRVLPVVRLLAMPGLYTWLMLACFTFLLSRRRGPALLLFIPMLMNLLMCIGSALFLSMRYELPILAATPLLLGWTRAWATGTAEGK